MSIVLDGTVGITTPNVSTDTSTLGPLTQALNLGSTGQIVFPATQNASANANTLDDYEEGTWTPVDNSGAGLTLTVGSGTSQYTKIGNMVFLSTEITFPSTANTLDMTIGGLPFTAAGFPNPGAFGGFIRFNNANIGFFSIATLPGENLVVTRNLTGGSPTNANLSTRRLDFILVYKAA